MINPRDVDAIIGAIDRLTAAVKEHTRISGVMYLTRACTSNNYSNAMCLKQVVEFLDSIDPAAKKEERSNDAQS